MYVLANSTFFCLSFLSLSLFLSFGCYLLSYTMAAFPSRNAFVIAYYRRLCLSSTLSQKSDGYHRLHHYSSRTLFCQLLIRGPRTTDNLVLLINSQVLNSDLLSRENSTYSLT